MNPVSDLSDSESTQLWEKLTEIMHVSDQMAIGGAAPGHAIYKLARDCRDLLIFDQQSREIMHKLTDQELFQGLKLSDDIKHLAAGGQKNIAIQDLCNQTGCSVRRAKEAVEEYLNKVQPTW